MFLNSRKKLGIFFVGGFSLLAGLVLIVTATIGAKPARAGDLPSSEPNAGNTPMNQITTTMLGTGTVVVDQTNSSNTYTLKAGYIYKFEVWGAQGANGRNATDGVSGGAGGLGSYAIGWYDMREQSAQTITWFAGRQGSGSTAGISNLASSPTNYNGIPGGTAGNIGGGGGGASGIRLNTTELIIAGGGGGGGGGGYSSRRIGITTTAGGTIGGAGGGPVGSNGENGNGESGGGNSGYGGNPGTHGSGGNYYGNYGVKGFDGTATSGGNCVSLSSQTGGSGGGGGGGLARGNSGGGGGSFSYGSSGGDLLESGSGGGGAGGLNYVNAASVVSISDGTATSSWTQRTGHGRILITEYLVYSVALPPQFGEGWILVS